MLRSGRIGPLQRVRELTHTEAHLEPEKQEKGDGQSGKCGKKPPRIMMHTTNHKIGLRKQHRKEGRSSPTDPHTRAVFVIPRAERHGEMIQGSRDKGNAKKGGLRPP